MKITLLFGTETGNAEMVAEDIAADLEDAHETSVMNLSDFDPAAFDVDDFYLLICSTYGDGELPSSAQPFAASIAKTKPDLSGVRFGIFGMGDSEYAETFNFGPKKLAALMAEFGATQIGERIAHDASGPDLAEDLALPWAQEIVASAPLGETA